MTLTELHSRRVANIISSEHDPGVDDVMMSNGMTSNV
jgi:hypothetical protein